MQRADSQTRSRTEPELELFRRWMTFLFPEDSSQCARIIQTIESIDSKRYGSIQALANCDAWEMFELAADVETKMKTSLVGLQKLISFLRRNGRALDATDMLENWDQYVDRNKYWKMAPFSQGACKEWAASVNTHTVTTDEFQSSLNIAMMGALILSFSMGLLAAFSFADVAAVNMSKIACTDAAVRDHIIGLARWQQIDTQEDPHFAQAEDNFTIHVPGGGTFDALAYLGSDITASGIGPFWSYTSCGKKFDAAITYVLDEIPQKQILSYLHQYEKSTLQSDWFVMQAMLANGMFVAVILGAVFLGLELSETDIQEHEDNNSTLIYYFDDHDGMAAFFTWTWAVFVCIIVVFWAGLITFMSCIGNLIVLLWSTKSGIFGLWCEIISVGIALCWHCLSMQGKKKHNGRRKYVSCKTSMICYLAQPQARHSKIRYLFQPQPCANAASCVKHYFHSGNAKLMVPFVPNFELRMQIQTE
eukprot:SAG11_NODE_710_length_7643_cov_26.058177_5_plen_476_part_00